MVTHSCKPSTQEAKTKGLSLKFGLDSESLSRIYRCQQDGSAGQNTDHHAQGPEFDVWDPHHRRKEPTDFRKMPSDLQVPDTVCVHPYTCTHKTKCQKRFSKASFYILDV